MLPLGQCGVELHILLRYQLDWKKIQTIQGSTLTSVLYWHAHVFQYLNNQLCLWTLQPIVNFVMIPLMFEDPDFKGEEMCDRLTIS